MKNIRFILIGIAVMILGGLWLAISAITLQGAGTVHFILAFICIFAGIFVMYIDPEKADRKFHAKVSKDMPRTEKPEQLREVDAEEIKAEQDDMATEENTAKKKPTSGCLRMAGIGILILGDIGAVYSWPRGGGIWFLVSFLCVCAGILMMYTDTSKIRAGAGNTDEVDEQTCKKKAKVDNIVDLVLTIGSVVIILGMMFWPTILNFIKEQLLEMLRLLLHS